MATVKQTVKQTKSFTGPTSNSEWSWKQEIIEKFNDDYISTNKSIITVNSYLTRAYSNSEFGGTAECNISCRDSANTLILNKTVNKTFNWPTYVSVNNWILVQSETFEVLHNTDGTQSITVVSMLNTTDFQPNNAYILSTMQLTTIPRTSKVTCPSFNIGESTVINIERASNNFTHTLKYVFGTANGPIVSKTASISVGWTPSADIFHGQIPNATSRKGKIICETYNGNILIGTSECEFTAYVTQANPDVSATIVDTNSTTIALTGSSSKLIKYFSKPKVTISATPKKKATIASYRTVVGDGQQSNTQETTFPKIDANGINVYATDSRGWTGSKSYNPTFINYIKLAFTSIDIDRTESTSTTVHFNIRGNYFNASFGAISNTLSLKWRNRIVGGKWGDYFNYTPTISGNTFNMNVSSTLVFDNNLDYEFEVVISDKLMTNVSTGIVLVTKGTGVVDIYKNKIDFNVPINVTDIPNKKYISGLLGGINTNVGFNTALTQGEYVVSGNNIPNAPYTGYCWGKLIVTVNTGGAVVSGNNWIWQHFIDTSGREYRRMSINDINSWTAWVSIQNTNPYPIGSVYISVNTTSPATLFGGTWVQINGAFLWATTSASKQTGGSYTTGSTTLTLNQIPSHNHGENINNNSGAKVPMTLSGGGGSSKSGSFINVNYVNSYTGAQVLTDNAGGTQGHTHPQNLPPYFTVYAWYRTA